MPRFAKDHTQTGKTHLDFPEIRDEKRRVVGMHVYRGTATYREPTDEEKSRPWWCGYERTAPGMVYTAQTHATRNGLNYGASNRTMEFETEAEREAWINKAIADTRKRYAKKYSAAL